MLQMSRTDGGRGPATDPPLTAEREVEGPFSVFPTQAEAGWWDKGRLASLFVAFPCHKKGRALATKRLRKVLPENPKCRRGRLPQESV